MKALHKKRLLKLAAHLRSGKLGHKKFDFASVNADENGEELDSNGCGALGCAIGECPIVFPRLWEFRRGRPAVRGRRLKRGLFWDPSLVASEEFFGLSREAMLHLFHPRHQLPSRFGGVFLTGSATKEMAASNIEAFVKRKEKESQ